MTENKKRKVLLAGLGAMGRLQAARIPRTAGFELSGIVTRTKPEEQIPPESTELTVEEIKKVAHYTDWLEALEQVKPDVAVITTPLHCHVAMAEAALEHGCDVFLEKPFTLDIAAGERLIALAERKGKILFIAHCVEFMKHYRYVIDLLESGELGELVYWQLERSSGRPTWGNWQDPEVLKSCGGALFDLVIHDIDLVRCALGTPESIEQSAAFKNKFGLQKVEALWNYPGKPALVRISGGFFEPSQVPFRAAFTAQFERGCVVCRPEIGAGVTVVSASGERKVEFEDNDSYLNELLYFEECVLKRQTPRWGSASGALESIKICYRHQEE